MNFAARLIVQLNAPSTACPIDENTPPTRPPSELKMLPPPIGWAVAASAGGALSSAAPTATAAIATRVKVIRRQRIGEPPELDAPGLGQHRGDHDQDQHDA